MRKRAAILFSVAAVVSAGCVQTDPIPRFTPAWEKVDFSEPGWRRTRMALVVSDCQIHNLLSKSVPERNLSAEAGAATAIRPPQLDLFSGDVLGWILREGAPDAEVVLHLGDALDLACEEEFSQFVGIMESGGRPWFMAPGNHDCYYFGTYDPEHVALWDDACFLAGARLPKDRFIRLYVAALVRQREPGVDALAEALGLAGRREEPLASLADAVPDSFAWRAPAGSGALLSRIEWRIDPKEPWRSFLVQAVDTTAPGESRWTAQVVLMDSCQYQRRPGLIPNAWEIWPLALNVGFTGKMLPDQLRVVRSWLEDPDAPRTTVLMSHHPFDGYAPRTRSSVAWLWREHPVGLLATGHTHEGYFRYHDVGDDQDELELNLASTTDWPMEWRTLVGYVREADATAYIRTDRFSLVEELRRRGGFFEPGWEVPIDAPDDYRHYKVGEAAAGVLVDFYLAHHLTPPWLPQPIVRPNAAAQATEASVKDTLLWTYHRLLTRFPTDPSVRPPRWPERCVNDQDVLDKILRVAMGAQELEDKVRFLKELAAFERSRASADPATGESTDDVRARFKISQAAWASRFEGSQGRQLSVEDDLVRVDVSRDARLRTQPDG